MEFPRQKYWSGFPFPSPGDLPNPGIKITSPALAGRFFTTEPPGKPIIIVIVGLILNIKTDGLVMDDNTHQGLKYTHTHTHTHTHTTYNPIKVKDNSSDDP